VVAVVVACVAGVVSAVTGAANPVSAVQFLLPGHWVYNATLSSVFHIDGSTGNVDARAHVPGDTGDQVLQGDTSGYVVGSSRITEFGKSSLEVESSTRPESRTKPVGVETAGGPYLVYQTDGKVVRLGDPALVVSLGGPVGAPVATKDGTLWLPRTSAGHLCRLPVGSQTVSCAIPLPKGHAGALTVVGERLMFVDTTADTLHTVEKDGLGEGRDLGIDAPDDAKVATTDVDGRVAILAGHRMNLVDTTEDDPAEPVVVDLPAGDYADPVSTGEVVAVVDRETDTLSTYDSAGKPKESTTLPAEDGDPRITRGEDDRIYVDGAEGEHVVVVDRDGGLTDVPIEGAGGEPQQEAPPQGGDDPDSPVAEPPNPKPGTTPPPDVDREPQNPPSNPPVANQPPPEVPSTPPGAPTTVSATAGDQSAVVNWGPAPDNRSPITDYTISWPGGSTTAVAGARSVTVGGLANGTGYVFTVTATNARGTGPGVSTNPVTPVAPFRPAGAPTNLAADNDTGNSTISASWAAPADLGTGPFAHYVVEVVGLRTVTVTDTSVSFTDLQVDQEVTVNVSAVTTDPGGQLVQGPVATAVTGQPGGGTAAVNLSRGPATDEYCGDLPGCAWMHVELTGFPPNTEVSVEPHSTEPTYHNDGHTFITDENGNGGGDKFAYAGVGETVHVNADFNGTQVRSNDVFWEAG
jgi:hypothetical protein